MTNPCFAGRRRASWLAGLPLVLGLLAGCSASAFRTVDVNRPLEVDGMPKPKTLAEPLRSSMREVKGSGDLFDVYKYDDRSIDRRVEELIAALELVPDNPYAWLYLGSYLQLALQPEAAAVATVEALRTVNEAGWLSAEQRREVQTVARLNLGSYLSSIERYEESFAALESIGPAENLNAFHRTAYYWQAIQAQVGLGETEPARDLLRAARAIPEEELAGESGRAWDYPRYFGGHREAALDYLEARILMEEGDFDGAIDLLEEALAPKELDGDPRLWDARYALINALFGAGRLEEALDELRCLQADGVACGRPTLPRKQFYRPENLVFNRGNILFRRGEAVPAIESYDVAIREVCDRHEELLDDVDELADLGPEMPAWREIYLLVTEERNRYFPEALNNCGNAYLELHRAQAKGEVTSAEVEGPLARGLCGGAVAGTRSRPACEPPAEWDGLLEAAQGSFEQALRSTRTPSVVRSNLAEVFWAKGEADSFLRTMADLLKADPTYRPGIEALRSRLGEVDDPELRARAYAVLLNVLRYQGPPSFLEESYGDLLEQARRELRSGGDELETGRAIARLYALDLDADAPEEVAAFHREARRRFPDELWPVVGLARAGAARGDGGAADLLEAGQAIVARLSRKERSEPWIYAEVRDFLYLRGSAMLARGNLEQARALIAESLEIDPHWTRARLTLSTL